MPEKVTLSAEDILIWLDAQDSANQQLRMAIKKLQNNKIDVQLTRGSNELPFNVKNIPWKPKKGDKGPFDLSDAYDNADHQQLLAFVKEHAGGAVTSEGFYYWIFPDGKTIGRKPSNQVKRPR